MAVGGVFGVGGGALTPKHVSSFAVWGSVIVGAVLGGLGLLLLNRW